MTEQNHPFITCLLNYQAACNAHKMETAVATFTEDSIIEINGQLTQGQLALHDAHEYDRGADPQVMMTE